MKNILITEPWKRELHKTGNHLVQVREAEAQKGKGTYPSSYSINSRYMTRVME